MSSVAAAGFRVVREAAINLLIHQDYGDHSRKTVIQFHTDGIHLWNPGDSYTDARRLLEPGHAAPRIDNDRARKAYSIFLPERTRLDLSTPEVTAEVTAEVRPLRAGAPARDLRWAVALSGPCLAEIDAARTGCARRPPGLHVSQ